MFHLSTFFIGTAYAQGASAVGASNGLDFSLLINYWPLFAIILVFYFLVFRPQQEKLDKQGQMLRALQKGDHVITNSGIYGKVTKVEADNTVMLEIADGVAIKLVKHQIQSAVPVAGIPGSTDKAITASKNGKK